VPVRHRGAGRKGGTGGEQLAGVRWALVDGRNVQGAFRRAMRGELPDAALVARLRVALAGIDTRLVLDGHPAGGPRGRIAAGFDVAYGRGRDADSVIGELVVEAARELGPAGADAILVVTDDRAVRDHARAHGARVAGTGWLVERVERAARGSVPGSTPARPGTSIGLARPPRSTRSPGPSRRTFGR
jgi:YacP-like NYN domain